MQRQLLNSKIHRVTITETNLEYEGSITIDEDLMDASGMAHWEKVLVANVTNGSRLETYCIPGPRGSGVICMNGAAAHHANEGDIAIIISFALLTKEEIDSHRPKVVRVDEKNRITKISEEETVSCQV